LEKSFSSTTITSARAPLNCTPCYGALEVSVLLLLLLLLQYFNVVHCTDWLILLTLLLLLW